MIQILIHPGWTQTGIPTLQSEIDLGVSCFNEKLDRNFRSVKAVKGIGSMRTILLSVLL